MENTSYETETVNVVAEIKKTFNSIKMSIYLLISFCVKSWITIIAIVVVGTGLGFLFSKTTKPAKEASFFAHINYEMGGTVYNSVETINAKIAQGDSIFLKKLNLWEKSSKIKSISITPVVRMENILQQYDPNNASTLELFLENFDKLKDDELDQISGLYTYFKQHLIKIKLSYQADKESVNSIVNYLNSNPNIQSTKNTFLKNLEKRIITNNEVIGQIDTLVRYKSQNLLKYSSPIMGDQDFDLSEIFKIKASFERDNENRYTEMALSEELVVPLERINIVHSKKSIADKKMIIFPIALLLLFFFISGLRNFYIKMKKTHELQNK
jgi:hypothetical protein